MRQTTDTKLEELQVFFDTKRAEFDAACALQDPEKNQTASISNQGQ